MWPPGWARQQDQDNLAADTYLDAIDTNYSVLRGRLSNPDPFALVPKEKQENRDLTQATWKWRKAMILTGKSCRCSV